MEGLHRGMGQSTLLAALLGRAVLTGGQAALEPGVVIGEVDQVRALFLGEDALVDAFGAQELESALDSFPRHPAAGSPTAAA